MSPEELEIAEAVYAAGEQAAVRYVAVGDALDVASDVLHAAVPPHRAAPRRDVAGELEVVAREMSAEDDRNIRSSALGEGVRRLRIRADRYDDGESPAAGRVNA